MSFVELASLAGFYDQSHFNRAARECYDLLPSLLGEARAMPVLRCADPSGAGWRPPPVAQQRPPRRLVPVG